jgi:hypothetical protein
MSLVRTECLATLVDDLTCVGVRYHLLIAVVPAIYDTPLFNPTTRLAMEFITVHFLPQVSISPVALGRVWYP